VTEKQCSDQFIFQK